MEHFPLVQMYLFALETVETFDGSRLGDNFFIPYVKENWHKIKLEGKLEIPNNVVGMALF